MLLCGSAAEFHRDWSAIAAARAGAGAGPGAYHNILEGKIGWLSIRSFAFEDVRGSGG